MSRQRDMRRELGSFWHENWTGLRFEGIRPRIVERLFGCLRPTVDDEVPMFCRPNCVRIRGMVEDTTCRASDIEDHSDAKLLAKLCIDDPLLE